MMMIPVGISVPKLTVRVIVSAISTTSVPVSAEAGGEACGSGQPACAPDGANQTDKEKLPPRATLPEEAPLKPE